MVNPNLSDHKRIPDQPGDASLSTSVHGKCHFSPCLLFIFLTAGLSNITFSAKPVFEQVNVFVSGTEGYHTFRIPAVIVSQKGTVLAFAESHHHHIFDAGDIDIGLRRSLDGGGTWEPLQVVWSDGQNTCGGPTAVVDQDTGRIWLHSRWNHGDDWQPEIQAGVGRDRFRGFVLHSDDDGETWSEPREITDAACHPAWRFCAPGPGVGIQMQLQPYNGRLVIPYMNSSFGKDVGHDGFMYLHDIHGNDAFGAYVIFSDDHGETWQRSSDVVWPWMNENHVVELSDGRLMMNMRNFDRRFKCRAVAFSEDGGNTWSEARHDPELVSPICQGSFIRYTREGVQDRNRLLHSNPAHPDKRMNVTVKLSYDEGKTWPVARSIEPEGSQYSCLTVLQDMKIGLLYERNPYKHISFARFNLEWLTEGKDRLGN